MIVKTTLCCALFACAAVTQDWPTHRADPARSGISATRLAPTLAEAWAFHSPHAPRPAWPGPARRDAYSKIEDLKDRLGFDRAASVVAAGGRVFFGSSADDQLRCLDAATGELHWTFFTEGPIRLAPTTARGLVLCGSDDGLVYALDARRGSLRYTVRPGPRDRRVPGNGRMISVWPVRSSVVVVGDTAYCTAGVFPSEGTWLCAFDLADGDVRWRQDLGAIHPQGYLLASDEHLYVMNGRGSPVVCERATGRVLRALGGAGGTFCLLTGDSVVYGPGKTGQLSEFEGNKDHIATFAGTQMIVSDQVAWLLGDREVRCLRRGEYLELLGERRALDARREFLDERLTALRKGEGSRSETASVERELERLGADLLAIDSRLPGCLAWQRPIDLGLTMILAGEHLAVGGLDSVVLLDRDTGEEVWRAPVDGRAFELAASDHRLFVSTDRGTLHCFEGVR